MRKRNTATADSATDTPVDETADETAITFFHYFERNFADGHIGNLKYSNFNYADCHDAATDKVGTDHGEPDNSFAVN